MAIFLPNGIGDYLLGDSLASAAPLQLGGEVWYVSSETGSDAAAPAGKDSSRPLATLEQAHTNASDYDVIVLLGQHSEGLVSALTIDKAVTIVGATSVGGIPSAQLYRTGGADVALLDIASPDAQLRNIRFSVTQTGSVSSGRVLLSSASRVRIVGCRLESGRYDQGPTVLLQTVDAIELRNCVFINTSTTDRPESFLKCEATPVSGLELFSCTFDAGSVGMSNFYAIDLSAAATIPIHAESLSLLNGADVHLHASSEGWVHVGLATGGARVDW